MKWNKVEHRLSSFISINWRGRSLTNTPTIIELISATTITTGLTVPASYDPNSYPKDVNIPDTNNQAIPLMPPTAQRMELHNHRLNAQIPAAGL